MDDGYLLSESYRTDSACSQITCHRRRAIHDFKKESFMHKQHQRTCLEPIRAASCETPTPCRYICMWNVRIGGGAGVGAGVLEVPLLTHPAVLFRASSLGRREHGMHWPTCVVLAPVIYRSVKQVVIHGTKSMSTNRRVWGLINDT